jgi:hypothetical protein
MPNAPLPKGAAASLTFQTMEVAIETATPRRLEPGRVEEECRLDIKREGILTKQTRLMKFRVILDKSLAAEQSISNVILIHILQTTFRLMSKCA